MLSVNKNKGRGAYSLPVSKEDWGELNKLEREGIERMRRELKELPKYNDRSMRIKIVNEAMGMRLDAGFKKHPVYMSVYRKYFKILEDYFEELWGEDLRAGKLEKIYESDILRGIYR